MSYQQAIYQPRPMPPSLANARDFQTLRDGVKTYLAQIQTDNFNAINQVIKNQNQNNQGVGPAIASTDTIQITQPQHEITGTGTINTIIPPKGYYSTLHLFAQNPGPGFMLGSAGNIYIDNPTLIPAYTILNYNPHPPTAWGVPPTGPGGWWVTSSYYGQGNISIGGRTSISITGPFAATSEPVGALIYGQGTNPVGSLLDVAAGSYVRAAGVGVPPVYSTLTLPNAATKGDLLVATATNAIGNLPDVAIGSYLRSTGVGLAPVYSTLTLPNAATTGDLLVATGTNAVGNLADVAVGQVLTSGGVGAQPAYSANPSVNSITLAQSLDLAPLSFTTLPAAPAAGTVCYITDSTTVVWGATVTVGSGTHKVLVWYNGTNWTVFAA